MARARLILGAGIATLGIGFGAYQLWPYITSPQNKPSPEAQAHIDQREEARANDDPARYTITTNAAEVSDLWRTEMSDRVFNSAQQIMAAPDLPPDAPRTFVDAAWVAIEPLLLGDFDAYFDAVTLLGGNVPSSEDLDSIRSHFEATTNLLRYIPIDPSKAKILVFATNGVKRDSVPDYEWMRPLGLQGKSETSNPKRYPLSGSYASRKLDAWEMLIPIRLKASKGEGPGILSVALAWDPQSKRWMPIAYRLYRSDVGDLPTMVM